MNQFTAAKCDGIYGIVPTFPAPHSVNRFSCLHIFYLHGRELSKNITLCAVVNDESKPLHIKMKNIFPSLFGIDMTLELRIWYKYLCMLLAFSVQIQYLQ